MSATPMDAHNKFLLRTSKAVRATAAKPSTPEPGAVVLLSKILAALDNRSVLRPRFTDPITPDRVRCSAVPAGTQTS